MTFTRDATSLRPIPQSAAEFTSFLAGSGIANPFMACMFDQVSGPCIDLIGSNDMTVSGPFAGPAFGQTVSGWASKGILFHSGNDDGAVAIGGTLPDIATDSCLVFTWMEWPALAPAVERSGIGIGTRGHSPQWSVSLYPEHDTVQMDTNSSGGNTSPSGWSDGAVHGMLLQINRDVSHFGLNQTQVAMNDLGYLQTLPPPPQNTATLAQGQEIRIGNADLGAGTGVASGARCIYMCAWKGTDAELTLSKLTALKDLFYDISPPPPAGVAGPYWGPHFPDATRRFFYWGPHFPDGKPPADVVQAIPPDGAATFALDLESGATLTMRYNTEIQKFYSGLERRIGKLDLPKRLISGKGFLVGASSARATRAQLARYAAIGSPFLVGLPFEELTIDAPATATRILSVSSTDVVDFAVQGQRVIIKHGADSYTEAVVQSATTNTIEIDVDVDVKVGHRIVPGVVVFLDPQQRFARYAKDPGDDVELWNITCETVLFGYETLAAKAFASLSDSTGVLVDAVAFYISVGTAGNAYTLTLVGDATIPTHALTNSGTNYTFHFTPGTTAVAEFISDISAVFTLDGSFNPAEVLVAGDAIGPLALAHGSSQSWGTMGNGASLTMHAGKPVWDRKVTVNSGTVGDSIQSMSSIIDMGGRTSNVGSATQADWGRALFARDQLGPEWQWLKLFVDTAHGRQRSWWLPTWRADLEPLSFDTHLLTLAGPSVATGDFFGWYPLQRTHLMVLQDDGTISYCSITNAVDNHDGTIDLTLDGDAFSDSDIVMVSWLELCRFESDDFVVTFNGNVFSMPADARVVQE